MTEGASDHAMTANEDLAAISDKAELLAQLRDVHPPDVSPWPAPGWWVLGLLLIGCALLGLLFNKRRINARKNAWRREALEELNHLKAITKDASDTDRHKVVQAASALLRRVMIHAGGRRAVAALTADAWLAELHQQVPTQSLDEVLHPLVTEVPYLASPNNLVTVENVNRFLEWLQSAIESLPTAAFNDNLGASL